MLRSVLPTLVVLILACAPAEAQQDASNIGARLMGDAAVKTALDWIKNAEPQTIDDQVRICEVEAPPFKEAKCA